MNQASLTAFLTVTQWQFRKPWCLLWGNWRELTPDRAIERINDIWVAASLCADLQCGCHFKPGLGASRCLCGDCVHRKVRALWKMEALGVWLGLHAEEVSWSIPVSSKPIVFVGVGAGLVGRFGFDADILQFCIRTTIELWAWEGVGHMLALQHHSVSAWLLGMPRRRQKQFCGDDTWVAHFCSQEINQKITFGWQRMHYLCGAKRFRNSLGGQFADAMIRHRELTNDDLKCPGTTKWSFPGEAEAREFIEKVWPNVES